MVNMVGFHHREPRYNTAKFGEEGHYFHIRMRPSNESPLRARISYPCGWATFNSPEDAVKYLNHPGDVSHAARFYLEHLGVQS